MAGAETKVLDCDEAGRRRAQAKGRSVNGMMHIVPDRNDHVLALL